MYENECHTFSSVFELFRMFRFIFDAKVAGKMIKKFGTKSDEIVEDVKSGRYNILSFPLLSFPSSKPSPLLSYLPSQITSFMRRFTCPTRYVSIHFCVLTADLDNLVFFGV